MNDTIQNALRLLVNHSPKHATHYDLSTQTYWSTKGSHVRRYCLIGKQWIDGELTCEQVKDDESPDNSMLDIEQIWDHNFATLSMQACSCGSTKVEVTINGIFAGSGEQEDGGFLECHRCGGNAEVTYFEAFEESGLLPELEKTMMTLNVDASEFQAFWKQKQVWNWFFHSGRFSHYVAWNKDKAFSILQKSCGLVKALEKVCLSCPSTREGHLMGLESTYPELSHEIRTMREAQRA